MIRLVVIGVLLRFCLLLLSTLLLIELFFFKLHGLFSCPILLAAQGMNALSRKIAGAIWRPLIASKIILQRRLIRKKAASISGT